MLLLLYTGDIEAARKEIEAGSGHVTQIFTPNLFEALLPDDFDVGSLEASSPSPPGQLDETTAAFARAWNMIGTAPGGAPSTLPRTAAGTRPAEEEAISWDDPRFQPPGKVDPPPFPDARDTGSGQGLAPPAPTSLRLVGQVVVGLVAVSGNTPDLVFTDAEKDNLLSQVLKGTQFLASSAPLGRLTFVWDRHFLTVNAPAPAACPDFEACEKVWRDPALQQLGYAVGYQGCVDYVEALKRSEGTDWACVAFFTKYPLGHFAYAGGVKICMEYANGDWGPNRINRVFAHEMGHIFGAADEYGDCDCGPSGFTDVPNKNCKNCTPNQIPCLMDANVLTMCHWTRGQLGWWPDVEEGVGAVARNGNVPFLFVTDRQGNLWRLNASDNGREWRNLGNPGRPINQGLGAVAIGTAGASPSQRSGLLVFVLARDGRLYQGWTWGDDWQWMSVGAPQVTNTEALLGRGVGMAVVGGGFYQGYVLGCDPNDAADTSNHLWRVQWRAPGFAWSDLGHPENASPAGPASVVNVNDKVHVFIYCSDGNTWMWREEDGWSAVFAGAVVGAVADQNGQLLVFRVGGAVGDFNLWLARFENGTWTHENLGRPAGRYLVNGAGVVAYQNELHLFMVDTQGDVWAMRRRDGAWSWVEHGRPSPGVGYAVSIQSAAALGAVSGDGVGASIFIKGDDGRLWMSRLGPDGNWSWTRES